MSSKSFPTGCMRWNAQCRPWRTAPGRTEYTAADRPDCSGCPGRPAFTAAYYSALSDLLLERSASLLVFGQHNNIREAASGPSLAVVRRVPQQPHRVPALMFSCIVQALG